MVNAGISISAVIQVTERENVDVLIDLFSKLDRLTKEAGYKKTFNKDEILLITDINDQLKDCREKE